MTFGLEIGKAEEGMERSVMDDEAFPISPRSGVLLKRLVRWLPLVAFLSLIGKSLWEFDCRELDEAASHCSG